MISVDAPQVPGTGRHRVAAIVGGVLLIVALAFALTTDPLHTGPGIRGDIKGDEAVYVSAALSLAYDHNFSYERRDLERFEGIFHSGPEGIFLKSGKQLRLGIGGAFPYLHLIKLPDRRTDRLYFSKALIYPIVAAPFVRLLGMNGLLVLNVLLVAVVVWCGYLFLAARSSSLGAMLFTTAFVGASALPAYVVFWMPEILNIALVATAYFLWLYREVSPGRRLSGAWPQVTAAILMGLATYSKPLPNAVLVAPLVLSAWWQRRWREGFTMGAIAVVVAALAFTFNAAVTGEFNYQGGDRRTFYGSFPFDGTGDVWNRRATEVTTNGNVQAAMLTNREWPGRFARNIEYFLIGRHFGFIPYFFPGFLALVLWGLSRARRDRWRLAIALSFTVAVVATLLILPFTWSGGGGPTGNRYLLSAYPVLLYLLPPWNLTWAGAFAWAGGALFTAKILLNPFAAAKFPYLTVERGVARRLPVELIMPNDLPVMLSSAPIRGRIPYGHDPTMLLYFLDQNAFPPEPAGMWLLGGRRADVIVRTIDPIDHLVITAQSPIRTMLTISLGAEAVRVPLVPNMPSTFNVRASGVRGEDHYAYLMSASSSEAFVPHLVDPTSQDYRNLGAQLRFAAVTAGAPSP